MKDRIRQIMESQHMTQQVFAEFLGLGAATLSSIFNGRTRPTLNVVEAIKKKIPNISTDWLMFGSGEMFLSGAESSGDRQEPHEVNEPTIDFDHPVDVHQSNAQFVSDPGSVSNGVRSTPREVVREEVKFIDRPQRKVIEIRVFYDDQTWDCFVPSKK